MKAEKDPQMFVEAAVVLLLLSLEEIETELM